MRASKFLGAKSIEPAQVVSASKKLGREDAVRLAKAASQVIVAKGSKVATFKTGGKAGSDCIDAMLGPTGNLRAPALIVGKTVVVGFHEDTYRAVLG